MECGCNGGCKLRFEECFCAASEGGVPLDVPRLEEVREELCTN